MEETCTGCQIYLPFAAAVTGHPMGGSIVTYSGPSWNREIYIMNADGSDAWCQPTPTGGNSQGPSFSPDGKWVVFTAYFDKYGDDHGCEIYIIRVDRDRPAPTDG